MKLLDAWARRPSRRAAEALRRAYARGARSLSLLERAALCLALGEAAEAEGRYDAARWLYGASLSATDPSRDERFHAKVLLRGLLNASRLGDRAFLGGIAREVERLKPADRSARLAGIGATARGLERMVAEDFDAARRAFESAMGAAWESQDADAEAVAHHLLAQAWLRSGRVARGKEHADAALRAARGAGSKLLELRLAIEPVALRLRASASRETAESLRKLVVDLRRTGFSRLEALAWTKAARGLLGGGEGLLPDGHPDPEAIRGFKASLRDGHALSRLAELLGD
jgi:hypothetical protein